ncbi:MAG: glycine cleavage system protein GcvH [Bacteroidota bacterium]|nr:glycine cleavage system protein GcvH [Bacteroidota bacterium]
MNIIDDIKYTKDHEWLKMIDDEHAYIGITDFAQGELGDIVYVDINTVGKALEAETVFGTVEAVKTVSDLYLPLAATIEEVNPALQNEPELVNSDPYGKGWMVRIKLANAADADGLLSAEAYQKLVG